MYEDDDDIDYALETALIGGHSFQITTIEFLPIEKLMSMHAEDKEISGRKIWLGSLVVAEFLSKNPLFVEEKTVIELGAGTGLLGMMASRLGASVVYLTDHDNRSLRHMREDCATNNIHAEVTRLDWFDPDVSIFASVHNLRLIAGDVIYKSNLIGPFMSTAKMLLKPDVKMLLCHVPRAGVTQDIVKAAAIEHGISITRISRDAWNSQAFLEHASLEEIESADLYELCVNAL